MLQSIQAYRKNIVILVNKLDILDDSGGNYGEQQKKEVYFTFVNLLSISSIYLDAVFACVVSLSR